MANRLYGNESSTLLNETEGMRIFHHFRNTIRAFFRKPLHKDFLKFKCAIYFFMPDLWKFEFGPSHDDGRGDIPWVSLFLQFYFVGLDIGLKKERMCDDWLCRKESRTCCPTVRPPTVWELEKQIEELKTPMPYEVALEKMKDIHEKAYGYRQVTPGEFFGFRRTYEGMTGQKCPPYTKVG
jgi:hypothetical protein